MKKTSLLASALALCLSASAQSQLTNLPTVYINTADPSVVLDKENYADATVTVASDNEDEVITNVATGIRGRGNSTWGLAKKPYRLKFNKKIAFFNLNQKAKSWVLLANHADKTLMRNALAFEISRMLEMPFSPSAKFVDLYLNNQYQGNYMITDQMQVNPGRVEIDEMEETDIEGENLTGGYFLEIDGFADAEPVHFTTKKGLKITVKSPDEDVIKPEQLQYITNFIQGFEDRLFSEDFKDPEKGYRAIADSATLINWYIASELTANPDCFWSTYIYKKRSDDHLYFGPLWDYDIAFDNDNRINNSTNRLMREEAFDPKAWIQRMWQDPWFRNAVNDRWIKVMANRNVVSHLTAFVDSTATLLEQSQTKNYEKWQCLNKRVYRERVLHSHYSSYVTDLNTFIAARVEFLTASFAQTASASALPSITSGNKYNVRHSSGLLLTYTGNDVKLADTGDGANQDITFIESNEAGWYNLELEPGKYLGASGEHWNSAILTDPASDFAKFAVENAGTYYGYVFLRNKGKNRVLGTDKTTTGADIFTDKKANDIKHAWTLAAVIQDTIHDTPAQLTNLPALYINFADPSVVLDKENYADATVTIASDNEDEVITDVATGIRGRGNSTWKLAKKPYRLKFNKKIALFNLNEKAKSWVLLANHADKTLMRNAVAFEISRIVEMPFSPSAKFVDLYLNNQYQGNYMVTDQMQVNPGRVDIDEMTETDIEGENLTGGYFLEIDGFADAEPVHFTTKKGLKITVKSPDEDVIKPEQLQYITNFIQGFEDRLFSEDFKDPEKGYRAIADSATLINWYIASELTANPDCFWSTYIYKKRSDDHLYFGPLWDYDIAFDNDTRLDNSTHRLMREEGFDPKAWIQRMWQDPWMRKAVNDRWKLLVDSANVKDRLVAFVDSTASLLAQSQEKNYDLWQCLSQKVYHERVLHSTYGEYVDDLRAFIDARVDFLSASFAESAIEKEPFVVENGKKYHVIHSSGLLLTYTGEKVVIDEEGNGANQKIKFIESDEPGWYNLELEPGKYLGTDKTWYSAILTNPASQNAKFAVEDAAAYNGSLFIRNKSKDRVLGTDTNDAGTEVFTNKPGTDIKHAWTLAVLPDETDALDQALAPEVAITYANGCICAPCPVAVFSAQGIQVASLPAGTSSVAHLPAGVYVAKAAHSRAHLVFYR